MSKILHITTGDTDGIGLEITLKSLADILKSSLVSVTICVWIHDSQKESIELFFETDPAFQQRICFISSPDQIKSNFAINFLTNREKKPAHWFKEASQLCLKNNSSIVTAPMSKTQIRDEGFSEIGHTEILKNLTSISDIKMAFTGKYFSVILFSDHIPINQLKVQKNEYLKFVDLCIQYTEKKSSSIRILGLNPHAGDSGLIGDMDDKILIWTKEKLEIERLYPADSAFVDYKAFKDRPTFISFYHDQGLIPFKMAHGFTGYHSTLGLPFVRTSVDHGTAKELFGLNKADYSSMKDAILGAVELSM